MHRYGTYLTVWQITMTSSGTRLVIDDAFMDPSRNSTSDSHHQRPRTYETVLVHWRHEKPGNSAALIALSS
jgi:hypothetical protein